MVKEVKDTYNIKICYPKQVETPDGGRKCWRQRN